MPKGKPISGRHPNFKNGLCKTPHGYIIFFAGKAHHLADCRGYAYQHRINAEIKIGRKLLKSEYVHHKDGNKSNNDFDNLEVYPTRAHHFLQHRKIDTGKKLPDEENVTIYCECGCGSTLLKFDTSNRRRRYISGHNNTKRHG